MLVLFVDYYFECRRTVEKKHNQKKSLQKETKENCRGYDIW
jgi:hypothetical protein